MGPPQNNIVGVQLLAGVRGSIAVAPDGRVDADDPVRHVREIILRIVNVVP